MPVILKWLTAVLLIVLVSCNSSNTTDKNITTSDSSGVKWNLGIALWTFHTVDFPSSLALADSAGVTYVEPNTFHKTGPELNDSLLGQLSPSGIEKLKSYLSRHGLQAGSLYLGGGNTVEAWVRDFDIARQLNVRYVTAEPPVNMWDVVDSIAGVYGMKVAIHEHWKGTSPYWHPDSVLAAINGHPNFGACADLGHWPKSGINPLEAVKKLDGHIIGIHLKDIDAYNNPSIQDVRVGTGVIEFPEIFKELQRQNFAGFVYIERDSQEVAGNLPSVIETVKYHNEQVSKLK